MALRGRVVAALLALLLLSFAPVPAPAQTVDDGWSALDAGEYSRAESIFKRLAEGGDPNAMFALARMAYEGMGGRAPNYERAAGWYRQAADLGHTSAQLNLGFMLSLGLGVPKDEAAAERYYEQAVALGDLMAMNNLAYIWAGQGRNLDQALNMIRRVVEAAPDQSSYLDTLGMVLVQMGRYHDAIPPMCRAVILDPGHPELRRNLGDAYWLAGNMQAAVLQWSQGLTLYESPALLSEDGRPFMHSSHGAQVRAELADRVANGLPESGARAQAAPDDEGIESTFIDECQVPTA